MPKGRFFVMGCPRSGTTLLHAILAAHPEIFTFPETNYINTIVGGYEQRVLGKRPATRKELMRSYMADLRIFCGIANRSAVPLFRRMLNAIDQSEDRRRMKVHPITIKRCVARYVDALDEGCVQNKKNYWLDKTPTLYAYVKYLDHIDKSRFVHIIRRGEDVVASLHDASLKYPNTFWKRDFADLKTCIAVWNRAIGMSVKCRNDSRHMIIHYDNLIGNPEQTTRRVCNFLGVDFVSAMVKDSEKSYDKIVEAREVWKTNRESREIRATSKFDALFNEMEKTEVRAGIGYSKEYIQKLCVYGRK